MATLRNDWGEPRICPTLGFHEVPPGGTIIVADDEAVHWTAAGPWTLLDPAPAASEPAAAPAKPKKTAATSTPEGTQP